MPLRGSWFTEAFEGPMSNLQRFVAGEDTTLVGPVDDAIKTMALVEACYESSARGGTPIPSLRSDGVSAWRTAHDRRAPALLAVRRRRVRLDRRLDGGAAARLPAAGRAARDGARPASSACIAVQVRQTLEETRWLLELADAHPFIAGVVGWVDLQVADVDARARALSRRIRGSSASATSSRPSRTAFSSGRAFRRGVARLERHGLTYDILVYARQLPAAVDFARALSAPALRARSPRASRTSAAAASTSGGGISTGWRRFPTSAASCRVWSPKRTGRRWTPAQLRPYLDAALEASARRG